MFRFEKNGDSVDGMVFPKVTFELPDESTIYDTIQSFESFLKAAGYNFDGHLDIINDEEDVKEHYEKTI